MSSDSLHVTQVALQLSQRQGQVHVSAAVLRRTPNSLSLSHSLSESDAALSPSPSPSHFTASLFQFLDNHQFSGLDTFLQQTGGEAVQFLLEDPLAGTANDGATLSKSLAKRLLSLLLDQKQLQVSTLKKSMFNKQKDSLSCVKGHSQTLEHLLNKIETERASAIGCLECIWQVTNIRERLNMSGSSSVEGDIVVNLELGSVDSYMKLDTPAADAVNLLPKPDHPSVFGSLFGVLNRCKTKLGSKTLERWLRQPLLDVNEITFRQNIVELFAKYSMQRDQLRDGPFKSIPDLDTIANKMRKKTAGLSELFRLYLFTRSLPEIHAALSKVVELATPEDDPLIASLTERFLDPLTSIISKFTNYDKLIEHVLDFNALPEMKINPSHDESLQELHEEQNSLEQRCQKIYGDARTSWGSSFDIKLEKDGQKGYFLRTTKGDDAGRLQESNKQVKVLSILKNGVHFTVTPLERISERYIELNKEYETKQQEVVDKVLEIALTYLPLLESIGQMISELDVLVSFAIVTVTSMLGYVRPTMLSMTQEKTLCLAGARHPCVELMDNMSFISNDYDLSKSQTFQIITGPNMGGKSTYIRAIGSIVVLAQIGMFVPCTSATISIVDCILARVGAGDAVQKGVSTFMAEMLESSVILNTATPHSLIIIDELGRGTSTYDGFGLAWAISDFIVNRIGCFCLFATHFHELTALSQQCPDKVVNKHVSAMVDPHGQLTMLYVLQHGPCTQSFGIHVARSAEFPQSVINEAQRKANLLERHAHHETDPIQIQQGREKRRKIDESLDRFSSINVPSLGADRVKACLLELFPQEALNNMV